jgi:deoxycytidine triphosphate deaminase
MTVHEHKTDPIVGYGKQKGSKYQGQTGPTPSKLYEDE